MRRFVLGPRKYIAHSNGVLNLPEFIDTITAEKDRQMNLIDGKEVTKQKIMLRVKENDVEFYIETWYK